MLTITDIIVVTTSLTTNQQKPPQDARHVILTPDKSTLLNCLLIIMSTRQATGQNVVLVLWETGNP